MDTMTMLSILDCVEKLLITHTRHLWGVDFNTTPNIPILFVVSINVHNSVTFQSRYKTICWTKYLQIKRHFAQDSMG